MKKKKVFILGSINMDLVISSERMAKEGETISGKGFSLIRVGKVQIRLLPLVNLAEMPL